MWPHFVLRGTLAGSRGLGGVREREHNGVDKS